MAIRYSKFKIPAAQNQVQRIGPGYKPPKFGEVATTLPGRVGGPVPTNAAVLLASNKRPTLGRPVRKPRPTGGVIPSSYPGPSLQNQSTGFPALPGFRDSSMFAPGPVKTGTALKWAQSQRRKDLGIPLSPPMGNQYETVTRTPGQLTIPGLQEETQGYVARDAEMQRSTAQGQLDPGRYAHITGGRPALPHAAPEPTLLPPGTRMGGGSMVANIDGRQVLLPPRMTEHLVRTPYTPEEVARRGAERYATEALANPDSNVGRSYRAGRAGLAHRGLSDRQLRIAGIAQGIYDDMGDMEPMTPIEQRRVDRMRERRNQVRVPGYALPMGREQADRIYADAPNRRRAARGLPPLRIPESVNVSGTETADVGMGQPPEVNPTERPFEERVQAREYALDQPFMQFLTGEDGGYDFSEASPYQLADVIYENLPRMGEGELAQVKLYLDSERAVDPDGFGAELDEILNREADDTGDMSDDDMLKFNTIRSMYGKEKHRRKKIPKGNRDYDDSFDWSGTGF